jgi:hypothetical protein
MRVEGDVGAYLPLTDLARAEVAIDETIATGRGGSTAIATPSGVSTLAVKGQPIVDAAVGLEWFLHPGFSLLMGASTDLSAIAPLPASPPVGTLAETRMQRVAGTFGIGSYGDGSELLLGTELSYAFGKSVAVNPFVEPPGLALVDQRTFTAMFVIAGGVSLSAFRRTLTDIRNVVRLPGEKP